MKQLLSSASTAMSWATARATVPRHEKTSLLVVTADKVAIERLSVQSHGLRRMLSARTATRVSGETVLQSHSLLTLG